MSKPQDEQDDFVECGTAVVNGDFEDEPDEIETAKSIFDEIVEETEKD